MELPDEIYERIEALSEEGNELCDDENFTAAVAKWIEALDLVPEPKTDWEAATWLYASIGDILYQQGKLRDARDALFDALNCPGGQENPFVHYRLGQCEVKLGNEDRGVDELLRAYMLDGEEVFSGEDDGADFLSILKDRRLI